MREFSKNALRNQYKFSDLPVRRPDAGGRNGPGANAPHLTAPPAHLAQANARYNVFRYSTIAQRSSSLRPRP
jgi:hypothetical protein